MPPRSYRLPPTARLHIHVEWRDLTWPARRAAGLVLVRALWDMISPRAPGAQTMASLGKDNSTLDA